ncbi:hypothetical protein HQ40_09145 [Porphyromonas gulae]|uniref:DUF1661 domain-containing protein n=1 Tax=Porphyromonas gulae TaxID=111105 RepID=UPI000370D90B|nr:DUF1661 domain-containing protein [Porphyromonas gulae]KGL49102.1 hypothetical protein HQ49_02520 [Porphyromonas gulae]KGN73648.1 hypothetical protein HQ40_09145 [Porphyromonas gulae]KGN88448.1 hypothetical protein HQ46_06825 [Porphyromonas gulae]KGO02684.1 hypothetical protein HQ42_04605 [Porphyromonas gulae]KKC50993.1 hypothetical protein HR10_05670 [Porphyromonas gulae]
MKKSNENFFIWARDFFDCRAKTKTFTRHVFRAVDQKIFRATIRSDADSAPEIEFLLPITGYLCLALTEFLCALD